MELSKSAQRANEKALFADFVREALHEARAAADAAILAYITESGVPPGGQVRDTCGYAVVWVVKPSYAFRAALQSLGATSKWGGGKWDVSSFGPGKRHPAANQSLDAAERGCRAAMVVLVRGFPGEEFRMHSWID